MNATVQNIAALILGVFVGGMVNMGLIMLGSSLISPPAGVDVTSSDSIAASIDLFQPEHFLFPYLAHAIGTFAGALITYLTGATHRIRLAAAVGILFLCGGIANALVIPAPLWFLVMDIATAYLVPTWIAIEIGRRLKPVASS
jgi:hypothetical protein